MSSKTVKNYRWQCRRGMLELDLLLNNFVDKKAASMPPQQQASFELLLSYPDQTLHDLLMGNAVSSDPDVAEIVSHIQTTPFS
jgi:antitoxin CptB